MFFGVILLGLGGIAYATANIAYATLVGATDFLAYGWVWGLFGGSNLLVGIGTFLVFTGLGPELASRGGAIAAIGGILQAIGNFAYALLRGVALYSDIVWTTELEGFGFFLLMVGLAVGFASFGVEQAARAPPPPRSYMLEYSEGPRPR